MCFDIGVRTDFHIPSFREGKLEEFEFSSGIVFEQFMFGRNSLDAGIIPDYKYKNFSTELKRAVKIANLHGLTYEGLVALNTRPFCCYIYEEIKRVLPKEHKNNLRMYITLGTPVDLIHGVDFVFYLGDRFVTIDATIDPFSKDRSRPKFKYFNTHLVFSNFNLSQRETNKFAKKVVKLLTQREDE